MKTDSLSSALSGASGEYFVAAELSRRGFVATVTPKNTQAIDVLAARSDGSKIVGIQVKTNQDGGNEWVLSQKDERRDRDNFFYVFVSLKGVDTPPRFHIVPSRVVAEYCADNHKQWLSGRKRDGGERKDTAMRVFRDRLSEYRDQWRLLGLDG